LDKALGKELATTYSSAEMLKLLQIHVQEEVLDKDTAVAMTGALKYKDMTVSEVMTTLQHTFMLSVDEKLNFETIATIFKTGYSRIPVYEVSKNNIIGLLFVKDLIFIDPEDETPVRNFVQIFGRGVHIVWPGDKLGDVLRELKQGRSHMALVRDVVSDGDTDPYYEIKGIITLEGTVVLVVVFGILRLLSSARIHCVSVYRILV
jgi:metal transporter CNNM